LFGWEKVGMTKRSSIMIPNCAAGATGQSAPALNRAKGLLANSRLEMICNYKDNVGEAFSLSVSEDKLARSP
jgi:hypothetical protein